MTTKVRVEQIKTSSWTPSSTTYLRWDGTWTTPSWGGGWWLTYPQIIAITSLRI